MVPETTLQPDTDAIRHDLEFMTARWGDLPEAAVFEIRAFKEGSQTQTAKFAADWMDEAIDWIANMNRLGFNIYAVRNPIRHSVNGSAKDTDIIGSFFLWADCDDDDSASNVKRFDGPKYTAAVTTGRTPSPRVHVYWALEEPCYDMDEWRAMQVRVAAHFNSDRSVINPSRIMRVGGTVTYPAQKKRERGYVSEMTTFRSEYDEPRKPVTLDQMGRVFKAATPAQSAVQAPSGAAGGFTIDTMDQPLNREQMRIQALSGKEWHDAVIRLVGSYVSKGLEDHEIHQLTDPLTLTGYTVEETRAEVQTAIDGARAKGWTPEVQRLSLPQENKADTEHSEIESGGDWQDDLIRNSRGRVLWNVANAMRIMENDESLKGCLAFDEFRQIKMLTRPLPFSREIGKTFIGRQIRDSDTTKVVEYFNRIGFPDATKTVAADVMEAVCEHSTYHPVRNYLSDLPDWDGVNRVETWLHDYCAAAPAGEDEDRYVREVAKRWLVSAVARVMQPGCKADGVLILEGRQGARKSTTLRVLASNDWFGDSLPSMHTKDASDYLRGKWIIEMAELSNINKAEVEIVKAFIAREEERFRPAYARNEITYPRQCVFAGSTNKTDYLRDETGNRRFWPVKIGDLCDVESLARDRDQIWAEALALYNEGTEWWLPVEIARIAEAQQTNRVAQDAWEGDILNYIEGRDEVSCVAIASNVLDLEVGRVDRLTINRISAILTGNGWRRNGIFTAGPDKARAKYTPDGGA